MKTMKILNVVVIALSSMLVLNSCDKSLNDVSSSAMKAPANTIDCESVCIESGSDDYYPQVDEQIVTWGNAKNPSTKTVSVEYYNTETHFVLKVKSTEGWSDLVIDGTSKWMNGPVAPNSWGIYEVELPDNWSACNDYDFSLQVTGNGPSATFNVKYKLIGVCAGCDYEMTGEVACDGYARTATFVYIPAESGWAVIQGGLTAGAINISTLSTTNANSNAGVRAWEGYVEACVPVTVEVTWEYEKYNGKGDRIVEDGNVIGDWTAKLYTDNSKNEYISGLKVDEMTCGEEKIATVIYPVE